jgi:hypothetical protein
VFTRSLSALARILLTAGAVAFTCAASPVLTNDASGFYATWSLANLNQDGKPFWDNPTTDPDGGIGNYIVDTFDRVLPYYSNGLALPLPSFHFQSELTSRWSTTLLVAPAQGILGLYSLEDPAQRRSLYNTNRALANPARSGDVRWVNQELNLASTSFGVYYTAGARTTLSGAQGNANEPAWMAAFKIDANSWLIGLELDFAPGELSYVYQGATSTPRLGDFDDAVFRIDYLALASAEAAAAPVPEPGSIFLIALGAAFVGLSVHLRKR